MEIRVKTVTAILCLICLCYCPLFSQDSIYFKTGEIKSAKVKEVGPLRIKYYNYNFPDGPSYIVNTTDLDSIKYAKGQVDRFNKSSKEIGEIGFTIDNRIHLIGHRYLFHGKKIKYKAMMDVMETFGKKTDNKELLLLIHEIRRNRSLQMAFAKSAIVSASVSGCVSYFALFILVVNPNNSNSQIFQESLTSFLVPIGFAIATHVNMYLKRERFEQALVLYNSLN